MNNFTSKGKVVCQEGVNPSQGMEDPQITVKGNVVCQETEPQTRAENYLRTLMAQSDYKFIAMEETATWALYNYMTRIMHNAVINNLIGEGSYKAAMRLYNGRFTGSD